MEIFKSRTFKKLASETASLLILSYFVIVVFLGIGAAFMMLSTNEALTSERQRLSTIAFHAAEAGIERALYDLRMDLVPSQTASWTDSSINSYTIGPSTSYATFPYSGTTLNGATYTVQMANVDVDGNGTLESDEQEVWLRSTGVFNGVDHQIDVYVRMIDISPWDYAIFAGAGASGAMVNGNVDIRGSVMILGTGLSPGDYAIDLGGTAEIVGNNYNGLDADLRARTQPLDTVVYNGETVETLDAELRVKQGIVGLSGSSTVGQVDVAGNSTKETVTGVFTNDGFGGTSGAASVYSDNGTTSPYDLGDAAAFPSLSDPYGGYATFQSYLRDNALILTTEMTNVTPASYLDESNANGRVYMNGDGNLIIEGIVYIDGSNDVSFNKTGSNKTIRYTGSGSLVVTGNVNINTDLLSPTVNDPSTGDQLPSFPVDNVGNENILGVITPNNINFNEAQINVMGLFYGENQITVQKQTDIMGTIVSNYFDMGTNVPAIYQVPDVMDHLPPGIMDFGNNKWFSMVTWTKDVI